MKIEKILLPFDGSSHSISAAKYAINLAKLSGAHVTVIYCYDWHGNVSEVPESLSIKLQEIAKNNAEEVVKKAEGLLAIEGIEHKLETVAGPAGYVLTKRAKSKEYDLIVMGSHGHSDIAGLFLGSVTHKVLNTIYCPILIVP